MTHEAVKSLYENVAALVGDAGVVKMFRGDTYASVIVSFRYLNGQHVCIDSFYNAIRERAGAAARVKFTGEPDDYGRINARIVATMKE